MIVTSVQIGSVIYGGRAVAALVWGGLHMGWKKEEAAFAPLCFARGMRCLLLALLVSAGDRLEAFS
jgi:hypothetical protein